MLIRSSVDGFSNKVYKTKGSLWVPSLDSIVPLKNNVLAVLRNESGKFLIPAKNLVTDSGDQYYAEGAVGTPSVSYNTLYLSTVAWDVGHPAKTSTSDNLASVITGGSVAVDTSYPTTNDTDADNSANAGIDVVTWRFSYTKTSFSDTDIEGAAISTSGVTSWGTAAGTDNVLAAFNFTAFAKTTNDTLKVFVNHTFNGV